MRLRRIVRLQALALLAALAATGSGLPSHDHREGGGGAVLLDADHHAHGVSTLTTAKRLASPHGVAVPPATLVEVVWGRASVVQPPPMRSAVLPHDRAPPPAQPRAPPVSV